MNSGCKQGRAINFKAGEDRALEINYPDYNVHCPAIGTKGLNAYHEACVQRSKQTVQPFCCSKCHIGMDLRPARVTIKAADMPRLCACGEPLEKRKKLCETCRDKAERAHRKKAQRLWAEKRVQKALAKLAEIT